MKIQIRHLTHTDWSDVVSCTNAQFRRDRLPLMQDCYPRLFSHDNLKNWVAAFENGQLVAAVGTVFKSIISSPLGEIRTALIGAVVTLPSQRGKGLASSLLDETLRHMKSERVELVLISGNRSLYTRKNAVNAGRFLRATFPVEQKTAPAGFEVCECSSPLAEVVLNLYNSKPAYFKRSAEAMSQLIEVGFAEDAPVRTFVASQSGSPVAYFAFEKVGSMARIRESAGSASAILIALSALANTHDIATADWLGDSPDGETGQVLSEQGIDWKSEGFAGTLLLLEPEGLWYRAEQAARRNGDGLEFRWEDDFLVLHADTSRRVRVRAPSELCALLFGTCDNIDGVLRDAFDDRRIPLPRYGFDFI